MIELSDKTVGIWYLCLNDTTDWLCAITEVEKDEDYLIQYRFRYYNDNKIEDSDDVKHWYAFKKAGSQKIVLDLIRGLATTMSIGADYPDSFYEILNYGNFEDFTKRFQAAPFAHSRYATPEETEQFLLDKQRKVN